MDLIVDVFGQGWFIAVLQFELVNQHSLQLLSFLDLLQSLSADTAHFGSSRPSLAWSFL